MHWNDEKLDDAARLLNRAQILLQGMKDRYGNDYVFPPRKNMKTEVADSAVLRAAAVLAAAAVNILADELDYRERPAEEYFEDEEDEQDANPAQSPEATNDTADFETRKESEAEAPTDIAKAVWKRGRREPSTRSSTSSIRATNGSPR